MDKLVHHIVVSVFVHEGEDITSIENKLRELLEGVPKVRIEKEVAEGFLDTAVIKDMTILKAEIKKQKDVNVFIKNLLSNMSQEQLSLLLSQADSRIDDEMRFFMRLDKKRLLQGQYWITDSGDCFHIRMTLAVYPARKELAKGVLEKLLHNIYISGSNGDEHGG